MDRTTLASYIDHTLLRPEATLDEAITITHEAAELGAASVCLSPSLAIAVPHLLAITTVIGFPSGAHTPNTKALETGLLAPHVDEIDMVINLGAVCAGDWTTLNEEIAAVRNTAPNKVLKVILETAALTDDQIIRAGSIAIDNGVDFLKTSTGFHPSGGASVHAVEILARLAAAAGRPVGVKASGGIRTTDSALVMISAGATRLGCSATAAILDGLN